MLHDAIPPILLLCHTSTVNTEGQASSLQNSSELTLVSFNYNYIVTDSTVNAYYSNYPLRIEFHTHKGGEGNTIIQFSLASSAAHAFLHSVSNSVRASTGSQ